MTTNQEKELFNTLATLVTGVNGIQSDVQVLKSDVRDLKSDVQGLKSDVQGLKSDVRDIKKTLNVHSQILQRLDAKTDSIAERVIINDKRLTVVEKDVADLRSGIH